MPRLQAAGFKMDTILYTNLIKGEQQHVMARQLFIAPGKLCLEWALRRLRPLSHPSHPLAPAPPHPTFPQPARQRATPTVRLRCTSRWWRNACPPAARCSGGQGPAPCSGGDGARVTQAGAAGAAPPAALATLT